MAREMVKVKNAGTPPGNPIGAQYLILIPSLEGLGVGYCCAPTGYQLCEYALHEIAPHRIFYGAIREIAP